MLGVTNEFGEPVQLPNDGPEFSSSTVPSYALASKYIPNIAISSLPVFEPATYCDRFDPSLPFSSSSYLYILISVVKR